MTSERGLRYDGASRGCWNGRGCWCSGWRWRGCSGCGGGGNRLIQFFGRDDVKAGGGGSADGGGEREACEGWHDVGVGRCGLFGFAEQEADARAVDTGCVGVGGLGDDDAGVTGCGDVGDGAQFEPEAADVDGGGAFALADKVGDGDLLRAEAFGDAYGPLAAHGDAGGGRLREDVTGRRVGRVEAVFEVEDKAVGAGLLAGVKKGEAGEVGDLDLAAVDGEAHGDEGGDERDDEHRQGTEDDVEETVDAASLQFQLHLHAGSGYREGARASMARRRVEPPPTKMRFILFGLPLDLLRTGRD